MPTYSYRCDACEGSFEIEQRISEDPIKTCSLCGKPKARRQIISGNFILKGGGWYSDGYGSSKPKSGSSDTSSKSTAKSETKVESAASSSDSTSTKTETKAAAAE